MGNIAEDPCCHCQAKEISPVDEPEAGPEAEPDKKRPVQFLEAVLLVCLSLILLSSAGGLATSSIQYSSPPTPERQCLSQSFVLFSCLASPVYVSLHLIASYQNYEVLRRQPLQCPVVSWAIIIARVSLILWGVAVTLASLAIYRCLVAAGTPSAIAYLNVTVSGIAFFAFVVVVLGLETAARPFDLPGFPRQPDTTCPEPGDDPSEEARSTEKSGGSGETEDAEDPPQCPEVSVPPGTAWSQDWEQLAVETGATRLGDGASTFTSELTDAWEAAVDVQSPRPAKLVARR